MPPITINGNTLNPAEDDPLLSTTESNYIILTSNRALKNDEKRELQSFGVTIQEYLGPDTFLCRYPPNDLSRIRDLPYIRAVQQYASTLKTSSAVKEAAETGAEDDNVTVDVILHKDADSQPQDLVSDLVRTAGIDGHDISVEHRRVRLTVPRHSLADIAKLDSVMTIEEVIENTLYNDVARRLLDVESPLNQTRWRGKGQVVAIADTGFDRGSTTDVHPAFTEKSVKLVPVGRPLDSNDFNGHGTHVCGSALGSFDAKTMPGPPIEGTAPQADLVVQALCNAAGGLAVPKNLYNLFMLPYTQYNARVHSNSWGATWPKAPNPAAPIKYTDSAASDIDSFVWHQPDFVICYAAGNDAAKPNAGSRQIGAYAAAKNCITVGATESTRATVDRQFYEYDPVGTAPNDASRVASFSNRGPSPEGRIKPDIVAPGTTILSAASRDPNMNPKTRTEGGPWPDPSWLFMSGTSMATPLVAGCVAAMREALIAATHAPSAALIKALLINGATKIGQAGPDFEQGFGRVDLAKSIILPSALANEGFFDDQTKPLKEDESWERTVTIEANNKRERGGDRPATPGARSLKVTLVYSDRAGAQIQNNLNLTVVAADGTTKRGDEGYAVENNVEQVRWENMPMGDAKIIVSANRISRLDDSQPFAVVWRVL